jgi:hypothetical protein
MTGFWKPLSDQPRLSLWSSSSASWEIWNLRNAVIFYNSIVNLSLWIRRLRSQGLLHLVRGGLSFFHSVFRDSNVRYPL